jgi:hypothetical protein
MRKRKQDSLKLNKEEVQRGEQPSLLALLRSKGEVGREDNVVLAVRLDNGYQITLKAPLEIEYLAENDNKINLYKVLVEEVVLLVVGKPADHVQHNHNKHQGLLKAHVLDLLKPNQLLRLLDHQNHLQWHRLQVLYRGGLLFHTLSNDGKHSQHIGRDSPHSGFADLKRTVTRSTENPYLNNSPDRSRTFQPLAQTSSTPLLSFNVSELLQNGNSSAGSSRPGLSRNGTKKSKHYKTET